MDGWMDTMNRSSMPPMQFFYTENIMDEPIEEKAYRGQDTTGAA